MIEALPPDVRFLSAVAGDAVTPVELVAVIETGPVKPLRLVKVTLEVLLETEDSRIELGVAETVNPTVDMLPMNVDQHDPKVWQDPVELSWYSPATHATVGSAGSSAAPK
jgi:hypothetical protein